MSVGGVAFRRLQWLEQIRVPVREAAVRQVGDQAEAGREERVQGASSLQAEACNQDSEWGSRGQVIFPPNAPTLTFSYYFNPFAVQKFLGWIRGQPT